MQHAKRCFTTWLLCYVKQTNPFFCSWSLTTAKHLMVGLHDHRSLNLLRKKNNRKQPITNLSTFRSLFHIYPHTCPWRPTCTLTCWSTYPQTYQFINLYVHIEWSFLHSWPWTPNSILTYSLHTCRFKFLSTALFILIHYFLKTVKTYLSIHLLVYRQIELLI